MARNIQVTPETLESAASRIEALANDYQSQYDSLYRETGALRTSLPVTERSCMKSRNSSRHR